MLLDEERGLTAEQLVARAGPWYGGLKSGRKALVRDVRSLLGLSAIAYTSGVGEPTRLAARLEWPTEITETKFYEWVKALPKAKMRSLPL